MAVYDSCCWYFPLRTGCILIAIMEIIFLASVDIVFVKMEVPFPVMIPVNLIALTFTGLLLYGTILRKRSWLRLRLAINVIIVVLLGILDTMSIIDSSSHSPSELYAGMEKVAAVIFAFISTALIAAQIIFGLVVFSFLCELRGRLLDDDRNPIEI